MLLKILTNKEDRWALKGRKDGKTKLARPESGGNHHAKHAQDLYDIYVVFSVAIFLARPPKHERKANHQRY